MTIHERQSFTALVEYIPHLKPEMVKVYPWNFEVPAAEHEQVLSFIKDHGYLASQTIHEYSMKGHAFLTIWGEW
jgi:hypothetical protein